MGMKPRRKKEPVVPRCRGYNYHVFGLGEARCSICGWNRYKQGDQT